jgi:hypothetical protein
MTGWMKTFCLLGVLILAGFPVWAQAKPGRAEAKFQHAYAHNSCAPWDGPAWRMVLQNEPVMPPKASQPVEKYPNYQISLWLSPVPVNRWIQMDQASAQTGNISWCPAKGKCESVEARVKITRKTEKLFEGELRRVLKDQHPGKANTGRELVFPFKAPIYPFRMFCG